MAGVAAEQTIGQERDVTGQYKMLRLSRAVADDLPLASLWPLNRARPATVLFSHSTAFASCLLLSSSPRRWPTTTTSRRCPAGGLHRCVLCLIARRAGLEGSVQFQFGAPPQPVFQPQPSCKPQCPFFSSSVCSSSAPGRGSDFYNAHALNPDP